jgi:DNA polymerase eta
MVIDKMLVIHPHLASVPEDAPDGLEAPLPPPPPINWTTAGNVVPIQGDQGEATDTAGEETQGVASEHEDTWEDWALLLGAEIMADLRAEVYKRLHYTCSAGIAHNKAIAKVRSPRFQNLQRTDKCSSAPRGRNPMHKLY